MTQRTLLPCLALIISAPLAAALASPLAFADDTSSRLSNAETEEGVYYLVPELDGEVTLALGMDSRRTDTFSGGSLVPELSAMLRVGYRRYADAWGRVAGGGYLVGGQSFGGDERRGSFSSLGGGVSGQLRLMNADFIYLHLGLFAEGGLASWEGPTSSASSSLRTPELEDHLLGSRAMVGAAIGIGLMGWFDPYIYAEGEIWFGYEWVDLGAATWSTAIFGLQFRLDFAHR